MLLPPSPSPLIPKHPTLTYKKLSFLFFSHSRERISFLCVVWGRNFIGEAWFSSFIILLPSRCFLTLRRHLDLIQSLRSQKELEYSRALQTLYTIAAKCVSIDRYQSVRVLQARFVSVISTNDSRHLLLFAATPRLALPRFSVVMAFSNFGGSNGR